LKKKAEERKGNWYEDLEFKASQGLLDWQNYENLHSLHIAGKKKTAEDERCLSKEK
jgi:hypothetical protein